MSFDDKDKYSITGEVPAVEVLDSQYASSPEERTAMVNDPHRYDGHAKNE